MAIPLRNASAGSANETARPLSNTWPELAGETPAMILVSVDFPAPFSPTTQFTSPPPCTQCKVHMAQRRHTVELFGDVLELDDLVHHVSASPNSSSPPLAVTQ